MQPIVIVHTSCLEHTKLSIQLQPWISRGLCWEIDVVPSLFTLLQLEMLLIVVLHISCPNHTKLFVQLQPWICWDLCWEIDVVPPFFTLLQLEMLSIVVVHTSCPDHTNLSIQLQLQNCCGLCWETYVVPPLFTLLQSEMLMDSAISGGCDQLLRQQRLSHIDMLQGLIEMLTKMDLTKGALPWDKIIWKSSTTFLYHGQMKPQSEMGEWWAKTGL